MSKKKGYLRDDNWRWREMALKASLPEDFKVALYHLDSQEKQRRLQLFGLFFLMSLGAIYGCGLLVEDGICCGIIVFLALWFILPLLLSNYYAPTELSVAQELVRLREDTGQEDPVYSLARIQLRYLRWKTLKEIFWEILGSYTVWILLWLPLRTLNRDNDNDDGNILGGMVIFLIPMIYYFVIRSFGAGIYGSFSRFPSLQRHSKEFIELESEVGNLEKKVAYLEKQLAKSEESKSTGSKKHRRH